MGLDFYCGYSSFRNNRGSLRRLHELLCVGVYSGDDALFDFLLLDDSDLEALRAHLEREEYQSRLWRIWLHEEECTLCTLRATSRNRERYQAALIAGTLDGEHRSLERDRADVGELQFVQQIVDLLHSELRRGVLGPFLVKGELGAVRG